MFEVKLTDRTRALLEDIKKILQKIFADEKFLVLPDDLAIGIALSIAIESFADE